MKRSLLTLLLAAVVAALAVLVLTEGRGPSAAARGRGVAGPASAEGARDALALASAQPDPRGSDPEEPRARVGVEEPHPASDPPAAATESADRYARDAVYGVCLTDGGQPLEGVAVELFGPRVEPGATGDDPRPVLGRATTAADGRFRFPGIEPPWASRLAASRAGFVPQVVSIRPGTDTEVVLPSGLTVVGRVVARSDGRAVEGAQVDVRGSFLVEGHVVGSLSTRTAPDGTFELADLPRSWPLVFVVGHPDHVPLETTFQPPDAERMELVLELDAGRALRVEVVELDTARGVADAGVSFGPVELGRSDASGRLALNLPASLGEASGTLALRATAAGFCQTVREVPAHELVGLDALRIPLLRASSVRGRVTDPAGAPLAGVEVRVPSGATDDLAYELPPGTRLRSSGAPRSPASWTDAEGRFQLVGLAPAPVQLTARARGRVPVKEPLDLGPPGSEVVREIVLLPAAGVHGTVLEDGAGVPARVQVENAGERVALRTDDRGAFSVDELVPGEVGLSASLAPTFVFGRESQPSTVVHVAAGESREVDLWLEGAPKCSISGRTLDADGEVVPAARVTAFAFGEGRVSFARGTSDDAGLWSLELEDRPHLEYQVRANDGPGRDAVVEGVRCGASEVELRFEAVGVVPIAATDAETGRPLEHVRLEWRAAEEDGWRRYPLPVVGGPGGLFLAKLTPGIVDLRLAKEPENYLPTVVSGVSVPVGGEAAPVRVALARGAELRLQFVPAGALQRLPHGSALAPLGPDGAPDPRAARPLFADEAGRSTLRAVPAGRYRLVHQRQDVTLEPAEVLVEGAGLLELRVGFDGDPEVEEPGEARGALQSLGYR